MAALVAASALAGGSAYAACDTAAQAKQCQMTLSKGYSVLKSYQLDAKEGKTKLVADDKVLSSRMSYEIAVCGAVGVAVAVETGNGQKMFGATSNNGKKPLMVVQVGKTSVYGLKFALPAADTCAAAVLGVKKR